MFVGKNKLGDGIHAVGWMVPFRANNTTCLDIGNYVHFGRNHWRLAAGFLHATECLDKAKVQVAQARE